MSPQKIVMLILVMALLLCTQLVCGASTDIDSNTLTVLHLNYTMEDEIGKYWVNASSVSCSTYVKFGSGSQYFSGSTYIYTPKANATVAGTNSFSYDMWVKRKTIGSDQRVAGQVTGAGLTAFLVGFESNNNLRLFTNATETTGTFACTDTTNWHHLAVNYNGTTDIVTIYYDGILNVTKKSHPIINDNGNNFVIGRNGDYGGLYFNGWVDEFRFSNVTRFENNFTPNSAEYSFPAETFPPVASFTKNSTGGQFPLAVAFTDTSTHTPTSWNYTIAEIGNFTPISIATTQNPTYTFLVAGNYSVQLTVTNTYGSNTSAANTSWVNATNPAVTASFTSSSNPALPGATINFNDTSSGTPITWDWGFGDGSANETTQNVSHAYTLPGAYQVFLNVTNAYDSWDIATLDQVVTNATGFNQQDVSLTPSFTVTMHITDSTTGAPIPVVLVQDSNLQEYTTTNGTAYFTEAYGTVVFYLSATGYTSKAVSYIIDEDRTVTVQMVPAEETTISNWYTPWQVRIRALDYYGTPLPRVNITAYYVATSLPSTDTNWLTSAFGINEAVASDMVNSSAAMMAETDDDGGVSFVMFKSLKYRLVISNATQGVSGTKSLYPNDQQYDIRVAATGQKAVNNTLQAMGNTSLPVYQLNATAYNLSMIYRDTTGMTTNVVFMVKFRNGTTLYSQNLGNPGTTLVAANYTVINPGIGQELIWMFNATKAGV